MATTNTTNASALNERPASDKLPLELKLEIVEAILPRELAVYEMRTTHLQGEDATAHQYTYFPLDLAIWRAFQLPRRVCTHTRTAVEKMVSSSCTLVVASPGEKRHHVEVNFIQMAEEKLNTDNTPAVIHRTISLFNRFTTQSDLLLTVSKRGPDRASCKVLLRVKVTVMRDSATHQTTSVHQNWHLNKETFRSPRGSGKEISINVVLDTKSLCHRLLNEYFYLDPDTIVEARSLPQSFARLLEEAEPTLHDLMPGWSVHLTPLREADATYANRPIFRNFYRSSEIPWPDRWTEFETVEIKAKEEAEKEALMALPRCQAARRYDLGFV